VRSLFLAGLARDYCVHFTAMDAIEFGYEVTIVEDACRAIDPAASLIGGRSTTVAELLPAAAMT